MPDDEPTPESPPAWRLPFGWLGLAALAWVVYEVTRSPALGAVLICLKFGWQDLRSARWLLRRDPDPWRRRGLFWLYTAWGLWKTAVAAFLVAIGFALVHPPARLVPGALPQAVLGWFGALVTTAAGLALSALLTWLAVGCALCGPARLWLDRGVHAARRHDCWPPTPYCRGRPNRLRHLLLTACALTTFVLLVALLVLLKALLGLDASLTSAVLSVPATVLFCWGWEFLSLKTEAETPVECWPEEEQWQDDPAIR